MTVCVCGVEIDQDACQCSLESSDCIEVNGSGNVVGLQAEPLLDPDTDNLYTKAADGHLVQLPSYITNPDRCQAYHNASVSISNDTGTVVALNSEYFDSNTMHDTTTNNSRITIKTDGIYVCTFSGVFAANATGDRSAVIRKNGNEYLGGQEKKAASASFETGLNVTIQEWLLADEYIEAIVKQDSGGALNLSATRYSPILTVFFKRLPPNE
jgi:hypothetical protein